MRDLLDKDPQRKGVTRDTIVLSDLLELLFSDSKNSSGKTIKLPTIVKFLQTINLHVRNAMNTSESRHYSLAVKELKALKEIRRQEDELIDLYIRALQDERLILNQA